MDRRFRRTRRRAAPDAVAHAVERKRIDDARRDRDARRRREALEKIDDARRAPRRGAIDDDRGRRRDGDGHRRGPALATARGVRTRELSKTRERAGVGDRGARFRVRDREECRLGGRARGERVRLGGVRGGGRERAVLRGRSEREGKRDARAGERGEVAGAESGGGGELRGDLRRRRRQGALRGGVRRGDVRGGGGGD